MSGDDECGKDEDLGTSGRCWSELAALVSDSVRGTQSLVVEIVEMVEVTDDVCEGRSF